MRAVASSDQSATITVWMLIEFRVFVVRIIVVCEFSFAFFVRIGFTLGYDILTARSLRRHVY